MTRTIISPEGSRPNPVLSPAVTYGGLIFTSGAVGADPDTGTLVGDDIESQARQTMSNLENTLRAAGSSLSDALKVTVFLTNLSDRPAFNEIYKEFFQNEPPARSCIEVSNLGSNVLVEVEVVAAPSAD